jgi:acyl-lipid omega-6 desaturase (Delta-12 desaturase)
MQEIRAATMEWCDRDDRIAAFSYFGTFAFYFATLALMLFWPLPAVLLASLLVLNALSAVRLYVLQHDCGHGSLFRSRRANDLAGYGLSTFTLAPYRAMQFNHNRHHAHLGDLDARETGEVHTMTAREWADASPARRLVYRLYRNPLLMLPVGGVLTFALRYRWPKNAVRIGAAEIIVQNLILGLWIALIWWAGDLRGLAIYGVTVVIAGTVGVFCVYLQHNFEHTYWDRQPGHDLRDAALHGSSALDLGWWFDLATCNIAYHDLHHFNPRIPSYRLRACHRALRARFGLPTIGWPQALASFGLKLWDEENGRLVRFPGTTLADLVRLTGLRAQGI